MNSLEIQLHLVNGNIHRFVQHDAQAIEAIAQAINQRVFAQPHLTLFGAQSVATYPTDALLGISLIGEPMPETWLRLTRNLPNGVGEIREISHADYQAKLPQVRPLVAGASGNFAQ